MRKVVSLHGLRLKTQYLWILKQFFNGWGTELISLFVVFLTGAGYWYYKRGKINQRQKAGNNVKQKQIVKDSLEKNICQKQDAMDNSEQTQIV